MKKKFVGAAIGLMMLGGPAAGIAAAGGQGTNCPKGGDWFLAGAVGDEIHYDNNGDGQICNKVIKGKGKGNSSYSDQWLVKDNNNK